MNLSTERLRVRDLQPSDLSAVHTVLDIDSGMDGRSLDDRARRSLDDRARWLGWTVADYEQRAGAHRPPYGECAVVLAGTAPRGDDPARDAALGDALLASAKDTEEHGYAAAGVRQSLARLCDQLTVAPRPELLRLANVQHLATAISGRLAAGGDGTIPSVLALAGALHPTAAVCGTPAETAMELIRELEGMDRGRYAGPVGWVDSAGNGEWCIALRCAEVDGTRARLFAGGGIVADSDPAAELAEAQAKFRPMQSALEG